MMRAFAIATLAVASFAASAQGQCGSVGSCTEVHATPGCIVLECCVPVCKANPLCCDVSWDQACVDLAGDICGGLTCPSPGSCFEAHFTPGCEDSDCCHFACVIDGYCCYAAWDAICADGALRICGVAACTIDIPLDAVDEAEPCYKRLNDGCNVQGAVPIALTCGAVRSGTYSTGAPRDTDWYSFDVTSASRYRARLTAEFPSQLLLVRGPCFGPFEVIDERYGAPCVTTTLELCLEPGTYALIVSGGYPDFVFRNAFTCDLIDPMNPPDPEDPIPDPSPFGLRYFMRFDCAGCVLGDLDGDGVVGPTDLGILLGDWGGSAWDLNGDGVVGSADLGILLGAWSS